MLEHFNNKRFSCRVSFNGFNSLIVMVLNKVEQPTSVGLSDYCSSVSNSTRLIRLIWFKSDFLQPFYKLALVIDVCSRHCSKQLIQLLFLPLNHQSISVHNTTPFQKQEPPDLSSRSGIISFTC